jgi:transposase
MMNPQDLLKKLTKEQLKGLSKEELVHLLLGEQEIRGQLEKRLDQATEEKILLEEKYVLIKSKLFGRSSEKSPPSSPRPKGKKGDKKPRQDFSKNLCDRYPNLDIREEDIELEIPPTCSCCQGKMEDSGMTEDSEYLTVIPKKYLIVRQKRHKYRCGKCHGEIQSAPGFPRIAPGSSYGDEMILDVALSKFCDLIPVERYAMMAARQGVKGLPSNSLINLTHPLAEFFRPAYAKLLQEIKNAGVIRADETPHRMLEGHEKSKWYLWGFSSVRACYFEFHETRSGDVAHEFLKDSSCRALVSDVFSGYIKAVRISNEVREKNDLPAITAAFCNAHARRKFDEARPTPEQIKEGVRDEAQFYVDLYKKIYALEAESLEKKTTDEILNLRVQMVPYFKEMKEHGEKQLQGISNKSALATAINYLIKNLEGLTYFIKDAEVPIDNNAQERLLRNPVIGRKTWYGTHSIKGARTAAVLFSLVESCKLNKVNPREFFKDLAGVIHRGGTPLTPWEYLQSKSSS